MKTLRISFKYQTRTVVLLLAVIVGNFGNALQVSAHGGEDHGDEKPKTATTAKGTISRTSRLGDFEIMLKHPVLEPDTETVARFFITKFETNEAVENVLPSIEVESSNGTITTAEIEKTDTAGSFVVKIPALPKGIYTVRINLNYAGETDTATFAGVEIAHHAVETAATGSTWFGAVFRFVAGAIFLGLFGALFYFAWRMKDEKQVRDEVITA